MRVGGEAKEEEQTAARADSGRCEGEDPLDDFDRQARG